MRLVTRMARENRDLLAGLEEVIGHRFSDPGKLQQALIHRSWAFENNATGVDNENLEFLGDAVLGLCVGHLLFRTYPGMREGELTRLRSSLVNEVHLASLARDIGLGRYLFLGRGEDNSGGRKKDSILSCAVEAVFGAVFEDGGFAAADAAVKRLFVPRIEKQRLAVKTLDAKSRLQEVTQERFGCQPEYILEEASGPDHRKRFLVAVSLGGEILARGEAGSKKKAEQEAAAGALDRLGREDGN